MKNIALIGMSGCGKSVVGERLAEVFGVPFYDADAEIERDAGMRIYEIFEKFGEAEFRRLERVKTAELAQLSGVVISTGGGVVLNPENMKNLKRSSVVVFLDRKPDDILTTLDNSNRPLLQDSARVHTMYAERLPLYQRYADVAVANAGSVEEVVGEIKEIVIKTPVTQKSRATLFSKEGL